jgi:hypothetical protein
MSHLKNEETSPEERELRNALWALAREEDRLTTPPRVEARLMQAFDERRSARRDHRPFFARHVLKAAAVFVLTMLGGYWWTRGGAERASQQGHSDTPAVVTSWPATETVAWLDSDPGSLQVVRVRVASATLAAQGYALDDADSDGLVELEVIIGEDGMTRGVRVAPATSLTY